MAIEGIKSAASSAAISASANMAKQNTTVTETKEVSVQNNNKQPDTVKTQVANTNKSNTQSGKDNNTASDSSKKNEQDMQLNEKALRQRISEINSKLNNNTVAEFGYHDETNRVTIKIVDKDTNETIKEIPPEKTLDLIAKAWELAGILVDEKR